jgi:hypothetical protein
MKRQVLKFVIFLSFVAGCFSACDKEEIKEEECEAATIFHMPKPEEPEVEAPKTIEIYPNPCNGKFKISGIENADIEVFDTNGRLIYEAQNLTELSEINLENFESGLYFVKIHENNNNDDNIVCKILIEK